MACMILVVFRIDHKAAGVESNLTPIMWILWIEAKALHLVIYCEVIEHA